MNLHFILSHQNIHLSTYARRYFGASLNNRLSLYCSLNRESALYLFEEILKKVAARMNASWRIAVLTTLSGRSAGVRALRMDA